MSIKIWHPAEDDHLLAIKHLPLHRIAKRFTCSQEDVSKRLAELAAMVPGMPDEIPPTEPCDARGDPVLPKGVTPKKIMANLSVLQRQLIETAAHHKATGANLQAFTLWASEAMADVELAHLIDLALKAPRQSGERIGEKIARKLLEQCVVLPKLRDDQS